MHDLLQSAERSLKTAVLHSGEKQKPSPHQSTLSGWAHSNTVVKFIAILKVDLFVSQGQCLWHAAQKASCQTWLDHSSSGLHLAPVLALLLIFHMVPAKLHHLNIPICRSKDMTSPLLVAATTISNNILFPKNSPLDQGFSVRIKLSMEKTASTSQQAQPLHAPAVFCSWAVPKQESTTVTLRSRAEYESRHESVSVQAINFWIYWISKGQRKIPLSCFPWCSLPTWW